MTREDAEKQINRNLARITKILDRMAKRIDAGSPKARVTRSRRTKAGRAIDRRLRALIKIVKKQTAAGRNGKKRRK